MTLPRLIMSILHFVAFGYLWVLEKKRVLLFELSLQVFAIAADGLFFTNDYHYEIFGMKVVEMVFLCRFWRINGLLMEMKGINMILSTSSAFTHPFWMMMLSIYMIYFWAAQIGQICFGGLVSTSSVNNDLFYLMNFNDYAMSLITLFQIMVGNNWYVTCNMYCELVGNSWPRLFFIVWWILSMLILANIVVAFIMEIYS